MNLKYRAFGGHEAFRPQPEILIDKALQIFAIITPWGPRHQTKAVLDFLVQNYENFQSDEEITSAFPKLTSLSQEENTLRSLVLSCNQWIFKEQNKGEEYDFAYEIVCGACLNNQVLFVQVGHPFIYLDREDIPLQPLGHALDLSGGFSLMDERPPPLPSQLIGLHPDTHFSIFKVPTNKNDRLLFISRSLVPTNILETTRKNRTLDHISLQLSKDNKDVPFWLGLLDFN